MLILNLPTKNYKFSNNTRYQQKTTNLPPTNVTNKKLQISQQKIEIFQQLNFHNGPEGWVHLAKVTSWGHITSSNTNPDHISSSESQQSIN